MSFTSFNIFVSFSYYYHYIIHIIIIFFFFHFVFSPFYFRFNFFLGDYDQRRGTHAFIHIHIYTFIYIYIYTQENHDGEKNVSQSSRAGNEHRILMRRHDRVILYGQSYNQRPVDWLLRPAIFRIILLLLLPICSCLEPLR